MQSQAAVWGAYLVGELVEEIDCQAGDVRLRVQQKHGHLAHLTFDLHDVLQHQLREDCDGRQPDRGVLVTQPAS